MTADTLKGARAKRAEAEKCAEKIRYWQREMVYWSKAACPTESYMRSLGELSNALAEGLSLLLEHHLPDKERDWDAIAASQQSQANANAHANSNAGA